ncbi:peptidase [Streptacidiphilus pinicola]|uniref:Peptidase n=1 Tax=Streptacidiphilus pinicola TaxID=2219663 RepID=A0A2X0IJV2_9ACTN|nr:Type 1 glutamine amidotransferase-like domain-containing protein [Streptacidiphilus pinicola]RAG83893.1 peptidase [Streptacidiphilus pinicola]
MRLYLSSFRLGNHPERLLALLGDTGPGDLTVVANAIDHVEPDVRRAGVEREFQDLTALGFRPRELDLRDFFDRPAPDVASALAPFPAVWVRGGNAFVLRHALSRSGADSALTTRLRADTLLYAGYSAGACVLAPSLSGLELCDDPHLAPPLWDGLHLLDRPFVPHVASPDHPETAACDLISSRYRAHGVPHHALRDGEVLVVDGETTQVL